MRALRPTLDTIRLLAITACIAGIVHICTTFAMPVTTGQSAFHRLIDKLPMNTLAILPPITPATQPLPFLAADARYAMCRYDTSDSPVLVDAWLPDAGWLLAIYSPQGDNFYYVAGQAGQPTRMRLLMVPPGDQSGSALATADAGQRGGGAPAIVPSRHGIVVIKGPVRGLAYDGVVESDLRRTLCQPRTARSSGVIGRPS